MSPITSSATSAALSDASGAPAQNGPAQADETAEKFEGLLWSSVLGSLSQSLGPLGDVLTNALGTTVARGEHDDFYQHLRALIELSAPDAEPRADVRRQP